MVRFSVNLRGPVRIKAPRPADRDPRGGRTDGGLPGNTGCREPEGRGKRWAGSGRQGAPYAFGGEGGRSPSAAKDGAGSAGGISLRRRRGR